MLELCLVIYRKYGVEKRIILHSTIQQNREEFILLIHLKMKEFSSMRIQMNLFLKIVLLKQKISRARIILSIQSMYPASHPTMIYLFMYLLSRHRESVILFPLLRVLEQKTSHEHINHQNIKPLQYIPVNISYLELCLLIFGSELGDLLAISKSFAVITSRFWPIQ